MVDDERSNETGAIVQARANLAEVRRALAAATGGVSTRAILAELAQELASDLATYFEDLPMHRFTGMVKRDDFLRALLPKVRQHRVVLARYNYASVPWKAAPGWVFYYARVHVLGLGEDGILRRGTWRGRVTFLEGQTPGVEPIDWDSVLIRRVPSHLLTMHRWTGGPEPHEVAAPGRVLEALTAIAQRITAESRRDLELLQRFL